MERTERTPQHCNTSRHQLKQANKNRLNQGRQAHFWSWILSVGGRQHQGRNFACQVHDNTKRVDRFRKMSKCLPRNIPSFFCCRCPAAIHTEEFYNCEDPISRDGVHRGVEKEQRSVCMETLFAVAAAYMVSFDKALLAIEQKRAHTHPDVFLAATMYRVRGSQSKAGECARPEDSPTRQHGGENEKVKSARRARVKKTSGEGQQTVRMKFVWTGW